MPAKFGKPKFRLPGMGGPSKEMAPEETPKFAPKKKKTLAQALMGKKK